MKDKTLTCISEINALEVFTIDGIDLLIQAVRSEVKDIVPDLTTAKGRADVAALAHKVSKSKTALTAAAKDLIAPDEIKIKTVKNAVKKMNAALDALRDNTRLPLTEWETAEKDRIQALALADAERVAAIRQKIDDIENLGNVNFRNSVEFLEKRLAKITLAHECDWSSFDEFAQETKRAHVKSADAVESAISDRIKYDKEQADLEEKRKANEEVERLQQAAQKKLDDEREEFEAKKKADEQRATNETARVEKAKSLIRKIEGMGFIFQDENSEIIRSIINNAKELHIADDVYHELTCDAASARIAAIEKLETALESRLKHEAELAEIAAAKKTIDDQKKAKQDAADEIKRESEAEAARIAEQIRLDALRPDVEKLAAWADGALTAAIDSAPACDIEDSELKALAKGFVTELIYMRGLCADKASPGDE